MPTGPTSHPPTTTPAAELITALAAFLSARNLPTAVPGKDLRACWQGSAESPITAQQVQDRLRQVFGATAPQPGRDGKYRTSDLIAALATAALARGDNLVTVTAGHAELARFVDTLRQIAGDLLTRARPFSGSAMIEELRGRGIPGLSSRRDILFSLISLHGEKIPHWCGITPATHQASAGHDTARTPMRVAILAPATADIATLREVLLRDGHTVVAYVIARSQPTGAPSDPGAAASLAELIDALPPGMDLIVSGTPDGLTHTLAGFDLDLILTYRYPWPLPAAVRALARHGAITLHESALPHYPGQAPVMQALAEGATEIGLSIIRADDGLTTGPLLAQQDNIPLPDDLAAAGLDDLLRPVIQALLPLALKRLAAGDPGDPQRPHPHRGEPVLSQAFTIVDPSRTTTAVHNLVRARQFFDPDRGPLAEVDGQLMMVLGTSLQPAEGHRMDCADGPIWLTALAPPLTPVLSPAHPAR